MIKALQKCRKCSGRNFLDRDTLHEEALDMVCINCGHRAYIDVHSPVGKYILALEGERGNY